MFDLAHLFDVVAKHGPVMRVVVADIAGSVPREVGAAMLVWPGGQTGTIGGGTLEFEATQSALEMLAQGKTSRLSVHPLGPQLGQCCGGSVTLVSERITAQSLTKLADATYFLRRVSGQADMPLAIKRQEALARGQGQVVETNLADGWFLEPLTMRKTSLWIWGAGHVGRAMIDVIAPLDDFDITWIDTAKARFPENVPVQVTQLVGKDPAQLVAYAPKDAHHLIVTFSHALDLELCHRILMHGHSFAGLIGSKTKWVRFQRRLRDLGHKESQISRITCPIGDPTLGKTPQAIAISVAAGLLKFVNARKLGGAGDNDGQFAVYKRAD